MLQAWRPSTLLKRYSNIGVSCEYCESFKNTYYEKHLRTTASLGYWGSPMALNPAGIYLLQVNSRCRSGVFIVNFEHISHLALVFLLLILNRYMSAGLRFILHELVNFCVRTKILSTYQMDDPLPLTKRDNSKRLKRLRLASLESFSLIFRKIYLINCSCYLTIFHMI